MPQIDALLQSLAKFGAQSALLVSGEKIQLAFPTGKRYASQTTPHAGLVALVEEILPAGVTLNKNGGTTFVHTANGVLRDDPRGRERRRLARVRRAQGPRRCPSGRRRRLPQPPGSRLRRRPTSTSSSRPRSRGSS